MAMQAVPPPPRRLPPKPAARIWSRQPARSGSPGFPYIGEPDGRWSCTRPGSDFGGASNSSNLRDIRLDRACRRLWWTTRSAECMYLNLRAFCELLHFPHWLGQGRQPAALAGHHPGRGGQRQGCGEDLPQSVQGRVVVDPAGCSLDPQRNVHCEVSKRCRKSINTWQANLIQTYFGSPGRCSP